MEHIPNVLSLSFLMKFVADLPMQYEINFAVFDNNNISLFSPALLFGDLGEHHIKCHHFLYSPVFEAMHFHPFYNPGKLGFVPCFYELI